MSTTSRNTKSKIALEEQKKKDPNVGLFTDTSGCVSDTLYLDWSRIYNIFYNDDISSVTHDQRAYEWIQSSQLHCIASRTPFMPYINLIKWALDYENHKERSFNDNTHTPIAMFHFDVVTRAYVLGHARQLLTSQFLDEAIT